ncbi:hypothetical protein O6H91_11G104500 [Diphasiastrum complanatum]|uniref:Uncharacterized protein n=1 Tax=Diphasiastrum complanatum TaxID=34168 RepID=A0ACC2CCA4_DIPCM|nr:hypothetical protein O6H91_11G104500 [Diphasiastrum complanatum]
MMSFRRNLSYERPLQNGTTPFSALSHELVPPLGPLSSSVLASPFHSEGASGFTSAPVSVVLPRSWLTIAHRQGASEKLKRKGYLFKKPCMHLLLFFLLGFGLGLASFRRRDAFDAISSALGTTLEKQDLAIEWNGFQKSLQRQATKITGLRLESVTGEESSSHSLVINHAVKTDSRNVRSSSGQMLPSGLNDTAKLFGGLVPRKLLLVITPTYARPFQAFYLSRLAHTLKLVPPPLLWLVVDMQVQSLEAAALLRDTGIMYRHLVGRKKLSRTKDRGAYLRNVALAHIEEHRLDGIVYFADDHNVYSLELFEQLRRIKRFGTWPVGMLEHSKSRTTLYGPVCNESTVIGWHTNERNKMIRRFHVDISGFGFNSTILWDPQTWKRPIVKRNQHLYSIREGFQETTFIQQLVEDESQMEGLPSGCSKVMVWHLYVEAFEKNYPTSWRLEKNLNAIIGLI